MGKCICIRTNDVEREILKKSIPSGSPLTYLSKSDITAKDTNKISKPVVNPYELSKSIFNKLNEIRFNPVVFKDIAKQYGLDNIIHKANKLINKPEPIIWSESKYNILSNFDIKDTAIPLLTKNKYEATVYKHTTNKQNIDEIVWNIIASLNTEEQQKIIIKNYHHCIVSSYQTEHGKSTSKIEIILVFLEKNGFDIKIRNNHVNMFK